MKYICSYWFCLLSLSCFAKEGMYMYIVNLMCVSFGLSISAFVMALIAMVKTMRVKSKVEDIRFDVYRRRNKR